MTEFLADIAMFLACATVVVSGFLLCRNERVYRVRIAFIDAKDFPQGYHALPEYRQMLYQPKYWLLWTEGHWRAWLERQQADGVRQ